MKFIAVLCVVLTVGSISSIPFLDGILKGVTGPSVAGSLLDLVGNAGHVVENVVDPLADLLSSLRSLFDGLLCSVTDITKTLTSVVGSLASTLNELSKTLSTAFCTLTKTVNDLSETLGEDSNVIKNALTNVFGASTELVQTVNFAIAPASLLTGNPESLVCSIDNIVLDLATTVSDLINSVIDALSPITSVSKELRKALCSINLVLQSAIAIVDNILSSLAAVLERHTGSVSAVLTEIIPQLSNASSCVTQIVNDLSRNGECDISDVESSLKKIVASISGVVSELVRKVTGIVGQLTSVLGSLTANLGTPPISNIVQVPSNVLDDVLTALDGIFEPIVNAVAAIAKIEKEVDGLVDVAFNNVVVAVSVLLSSIPAITIEGLKSAGCVNGLGDHISAAIVQLIATIQTVVDAIVYLASHVLLSSQVAIVLKKVVRAILALANIFTSSIKGLLDRIVADSCSDPSDLSKLLCETLNGITSALKNVSGELGNNLREIAGAVNALIGTGGNEDGSLAGVSGSLCGSLSGATALLSGLAKSLHGIPSGISREVNGVVPNEVEVGSLAHLLAGTVAAATVVAKNALCLIITNVDQIGRILTAILSSLDACQY